MKPGTHFLFFYETNTNASAYFDEKTWCLFTNTASAYYENIQCKYAEDL